MSFETKIVNATTILIESQEDSTITIILALSTLGLAIITAIGLWKTNKRTRESNEELQRSNELLTLELREKYHPLLVFIENRIQYKSEKTDEGKFTTRVSNRGKVALSNIKISHQISSTKPEIFELLKNESNIKQNMREYNATLHTETSITDYAIDFEHPRTKEIWFTFWISFEFFTNSKEENIVLLRFEDLQYKGYDVLSHNQIQKFREQYRKHY